MAGRLHDHFSKQSLISCMASVLMSASFAHASDITSNVDVDPDTSWQKRLHVTHPGASGPGSGLCVNMLIQDPSLSLGVGLCDQSIHIARSDIVDGPSDTQFIYGEYSRIAPISNGTIDVKLYPNRLTKADTASVYANMRVTSDLFQQDLLYLLNEHPNDAKLTQAAESYAYVSHNAPLYFYLGDEEMENAYYSRADYDDVRYRYIVLGYYKNYDTGRYEYTAKQPDIIWHEMGHAMVDAARPDLFNDSNESGSFHEAWGDTNTLFTLLSQGGVPDAVLHQTAGDMAQENFVAHMAEQFGRSLLSVDNGLRDMDDDIKDIPNAEIHDRSRTLSGIIYDIVVSAYNDRKASGLVSESVAIREVSDYVRRAWVYTLTQISANPSFTEIGLTLRTYFPQMASSNGLNLSWQDYVSHHFQYRGIMLDDTPDPWDWSQTEASAVTYHAHVKKANDTRVHNIIKHLNSKKNVI